ncbi:HEPN domain-containing protein [Leptolyngbya sp. CCNP1308]|uniref:HEPN domain-containing protein n=1 Tax=Leptolyngbya sp. CCNP1308 TaxID=3110255 RepID=UPI002B2083AF|nr:HEPN domain-containing protein [Leptolyngbya sp. CCNP1308]MEA5452357.1 HEPN domain-containing protein [Leptolyngbya sp. CCNP1308]
MKPRTQEWVDKAEGDFTTAGRELEATQAPNYDSVCFHAQQCVEKYFKACLYENDIPFSKIHDLRILLKALLPLEPAWQQWEKALTDLTMAAVEVRYPGFFADEEVAIEMYELCAEVRQAVRQSLGLV